MQITLELLKLVAVGLIAGLFSSYLANRDHRQKKWWELRVEAYKSTIESLCDLVYYYDTKFSAALKSYELSKETQEKLTIHWEAAYPKVRKSAEAGAFLFSKKANAALREFIDADNSEAGYPMVIQSDLIDAQKCLAILIECSKEDLKLKSSMLDQLT